MRTLIFDCDGVLADTERDGHRPAFNQTFAEFGLPVEWSEEEYGTKLAIGGGKERMASLLTPEFVRANDLPADEDGQRDLLQRLHRRKTAIYTELVRAGRLPARPGIRRIVREAASAGWTLVVASTSAEPSVRAVLEHAVGQDDAARFTVLAGDIVPRKKPDPAIYTLALEQTGSRPDDSIVVEDSRNGLLAATRAGLRCVVTVNAYTEAEDMTEAVLVVTSLGDPGEPARVLANRSPARMGDLVTLQDLEACLSAPHPGGGGMSSSDALRSAEQVVRIVAQTALDNETYFGELDAVVGDGDLGYSLARGFSKLLEGFDEMDYDDIGGLLKKSAIVISGRIGGTSGPIWGTAFLRAGAALTPTPDPGRAEVVAALRAGLEGIKQRGQADVGDKTLIDALQPAIDRLDEVLAGGGSPDEALAAAASVAAEAAAATKGMLAKRGRAAYTGDRSRASVDAGATAVAVILKAVSDSWQPEGVQQAEGSAQ